MCRIGDACKQGMVSLFGYLPKGENLPGIYRSRYLPGINLKNLTESKTGKYPGYLPWYLPQGLTYATAKD